MPELVNGTANINKKWKCSKSLSFLKGFLKANMIKEIINLF